MLLMYCLSLGSQTSIHIGINGR